MTDALKVRASCSAAATFAVVSLTYALGATMGGLDVLVSAVEDLRSFSLLSASTVVRYLFQVRTELSRASSAVQSVGWCVLLASPPPPARALRSHRTAARH
jgi:hypothetical protein